MAQPPRNFPPMPPQPTFSPPLPGPARNASSPAADSFPPPPKRQRLSPNATSPMQSPSFPTMSLPHAGGHLNGVMANGIHNLSAAAPASSGLMGPPSRPPERARDKSDFTDVLTGTGIDIDGEEANMTTQFVSQPGHNSSFNSQGSSLGTISAGNSFIDGAQYQQPGSQETFYGAGPFNQRAIAQRSRDDIEKERQELRDFTIAKRKSYALQDPFLATEQVDQRLSERAAQHSINYGKSSILRPAGPRQTLPLPPTEVVGPDETSVIVTRGETILQLDNPTLSDMMSLISLACEDRLRGFIDQSARLAEERRQHSTGDVPVQWQDVAAATGLDNGANSAPQAVYKRPGRDHVSGRSQSLPNSVATPNKIAEVFQSMSQQERAAEDARIARRARREVATSEGDTVASTSTTAGPGTPATMPGDSLPDMADKRPTKKEQKKQAEAKASEAQMHKHANETARMATMGMGNALAFGKKKKTYSWLNSNSKAAIGATPGPAPTPSSINTTLNKITTPESTDVARPSTATTATTVASTSTEFGAWREDSEKGPAIEARDVLLVLEADGKAPRALQEAYVERSRKKPVSD